MSDNKRLIVKCLDATNVLLTLTKGQLYEVSEMNAYELKVVGCDFWYSRSRFAWLDNSDILTIKQMLDQVTEQRDSLLSALKKITATTTKVIEKITDSNDMIESNS